MKRNKVSQFFTTNGLLLIILLAFFIRMVYFVSLQPWNNEVINKTILEHDAGGYHNMALGLLSEKSFNNFDSARTPIYPIFLAVCYFISGNTIWFALLVQIVVNLLTLFLAYKVALEFFSKKIALLTLFLLAIDHYQAKLAVSLLTDTLFSLIFLASTYFLINGLRRKNYKYMAISGCFMGLATLTRPISFLFPIVAVFFIICYILITNKYDTSLLKFKLGNVYSLSYVALFFLTIAPWMYRNYVLYNNPQLTSLTEFNLLFYNVAIADSDRTGHSFNETQAYFKQQAYDLGCDTTELYSFKNSQIYSDISIKFIKNNFPLFCKNYLKGMVNLFYPFDKFIRVNNLSGLSKYRMVGFLIYYGILYLFSIVGVALSIKKKYIIAFLLLFIIFYFDVITGTVGDQRYEVPIMAFIYMFCAHGILYFYYTLFHKLDKIKY
jgi:4-amino-4-deoxy-L-arabinose transferase-like glycosyltransferase